MTSLKRTRTVLGLTTGRRPARPDRLRWRRRLLDARAPTAPRTSQASGRRGRPRGRPRRRGRGQRRGDHQGRVRADLRAQLQQATMQAQQMGGQAARRGRPAEADGRQPRRHRAARRRRPSRAGLEVTDEDVDAELEHARRAEPARVRPRSSSRPWRSRAPPRSRSAPRSRRRSWSSSSSTTRPGRRSRARRSCARSTSRPSSSSSRWASRAAQQQEIPPYADVKPQLEEQAGRASGSAPWRRRSSRTCARTRTSPINL